MGREG